MRHKLLGRLMSLVFLMVGMLVLVEEEAQSQGRKNRIPQRPKIFLNNNGSLLTIPNPNYGLPSQLAHSFVAVAHEDCRLFFNGATIMPQFRLLAAECEQLQNMTPGGGGGVVVNPGLPPGAIGICYDPGLVGAPVYPVAGVVPPGGVSSAVCIDIRPFGANFSRPYRNFPGPGYAGHYPGYGNSPSYAVNTYGGNYATYNPGSSSSSSGTLTTSTSIGFHGFALTEGKVPEFTVSVGTSPLTKFGTGFGLKYSTCGCCGDNPALTETAKAEAADESND